MLIANRPSPVPRSLVEPVVERERSGLTRFISWFIAVVLAFVVPLAIVLAAVFVSSWGIPLPFEVRIP